MVKRFQRIVGLAIAAAMAALGMARTLSGRNRASWRWVRRAPEHDSVTIGADLR